MMLNITLLPPSLSASRSAATRVRAVTTLALVVVLTLLAALGIVWSLQYTYRLQLSANNTKVEELRAEIAKASEIVARVVVINDRLSTIAELQKSNPAMAALLTDLFNLVPKQTKLSTITLNTKDKGGLRLSCESSDVQEAIRFQKKLEDSPRFANVQLSAVTTTKKEDKEVVTYPLSAELESGQKKAP